MSKKKRIHKTGREVRNYEYVRGAERIICILEDMWRTHTPLQDVQTQNFSKESKILWAALEKARREIKPQDEAWREEYKKRLAAYKERDNV